jgi:SRSO17 transposase
VTTVETVESWAAGLEDFLIGIGHRFVRVEPRRLAFAYVRGLLSSLERKNGWTLTELAGNTSASSMQWMLQSPCWDPDEVRDDVRSYVVEHLGDADGVLVGDETGFLKKGTKSAGVQRQYSGTAGRTENCQIGVFLAYASRRGRGLLDRELYLPVSWTGDRDRCRSAGIPDEVGFATKPAQMQAMIGRALAAGVLFKWFTADEAYGQNPGLRAFLEAEDVFYVMATRKDEQVASGLFTTTRVDELIGRLPAGAWKRRSAGDGAHGPRVYDWVTVPIRRDFGSGRRGWVLARRSISDPTDIAYYLCYGPRGTRLRELVRVAGTRWSIEELFQTAKNETGLDHYQVRRYGAWYAHITLSMAALAHLVVTRAAEQSAAAEAVRGAAIPKQTNSSHSAATRSVA